MASKIYSGEKAQSSNLAAGHVNSRIAPAIVATGSEDENLCFATFAHFAPLRDTGLCTNRRSLHRNMSIPESPRPLSPAARKMRTFALRPLRTSRLCVKQGCPRILEACTGTRQFRNRPDHCRPRSGR
jgi:hypothetical protein